MIKSIIAKSLGVCLVLVGLILIFASALATTGSKQISGGDHFFGFTLTPNISVAIAFFEGIMFLLSAFSLFTKKRVLFYLTVGFFVLILGDSIISSIVTDKKEVSSIILDIVVLSILFFVDPSILKKE